MESIIQFLKTDNGLIFLLGAVILLGILFIINVIKLITMNRKYKKFLSKLGDGKTIQEDLETYMYRVEKVEIKNSQIDAQIKTLDNELSKCIQKVGIVRYNAFKDTGSDLSFALALLDENNDGIVLNGIYSREMSNIYAKSVKAGESTYTLSDEEKEAIEKAIEEGNEVRIR